MRRIGVRELNQRTSRYLALVKAGETIEVTERGRPIARLSPVGPRRSILDFLLASGEAQPPDADPASLASLPKPPPDGIDVAAELADARDQERW